MYDVTKGSYFPLRLGTAPPQKAMLATYKMFSGNQYSFGW